MTGRAAIVGRALESPLGDLDATWSALSEGRGAVQPLRAFDATGFGDVHAALLARADDGRGDDAALRILGPHGVLLRGVAAAAHAEARCDVLERDAVGFYAALGMVDSDVADLVPAVQASGGGGDAYDQARFFASGYRSIHPLWPLSVLNNVAVGQTATELDLRGDNLVLAAGADAGIAAFAEALDALRAGAAQAALVAGVGEHVTPASLARRALQGTLGHGPCAPFARDACGASPGEGAAAVVLESEASARARDVEPLAWLAGAATAFGDRDDPAASARAVRAALTDAGRVPADVDLLLVHGDGTEAGDRAEAEALADVFGVRLAGIPALATKGALGDLRAGAVAVDVVLAERALERGTIPPTCTRTPLRDGAPALGRTARSGPLRVALVLAAGTSGGAGALVVEVVS